MSKSNLVLLNAEGKVVRYFHVDDGEFSLVRRHDNGRLQALKDTDLLDAEGVAYDVVDKLSFDKVSSKPVEMGDLGKLCVVSTLPDLNREVTSPKEPQKTQWFVAGVMSVLALITLVLSAKKQEDKPIVEETPEAQTVRIVQRIQVQPKAQTQRLNLSASQTATKPKMVQNVGRVGALGVLGSLSKSKNTGGLDLGALKATAGPGLGGTGGSGGIQTSLYAKGLVGAPIGPGANAQGGGGYGTQGKGGGQAGYGTHSLVGSGGGGGPISLGTDPDVEGGLDSDAITDVIMRNIGQIRFCYEQGLQGDPTLEGRVATRFVIGRDGFVREAGIHNSSLQSKLVEDCILLRLKTWKFPIPQKGVDVKVVYPFVLRKVGRG